MKDSFIFSSNSVRLSWRNWAVAIAVLIGTLYLLPNVWQRLEQFDPSTVELAASSFEADMPTRAPATSSVKLRGPTACSRVETSRERISFGSIS